MKKQKKKQKNQELTYLVVLVLIIVIMDGSVLWFYSQDKNPSSNPTINAEDFSTEIDNKYLTLTPGTKMIYVTNNEEGLERTEVYVTDETKTVMDVEARVVWDRVWINGKLVEDTKDWYAQDKEGNVWYFGEDSKEYEDGKVSTEGSWEAGVDGAELGIIMEASPKVGDTYKQEYYEGEAEDMAEIISLDESVEVAYGSFEGCLKTLDYTPLEPDVKEYKYYCEEVGGVVLETEEDTKTELVSVMYDAEPSP